MRSCVISHAESRPRFYRHDYRAIGDLFNFMHAMRDVNDADVVCLEILSEFEQRRVSVSVKLDVGSSMMMIHAPALSARAISTSCCCAIES